MTTIINALPAPIYHWLFQTLTRHLAGEFCALLRLVDGRKP